MLNDITVNNNQSSTIGKIQRPSIRKPEIFNEFHNTKFVNVPLTQTRSLSPKNHSLLNRSNSISPDRSIGEKNLMRDSQKLKLIINENEPEKYLYDNEGKKMGLQRVKSVVEKTTYISRLHDKENQDQLDKSVRIDEKPKISLSKFISLKGISVAEKTTFVSRMSVNSIPEHL